MVHHTPHSRTLEYMWEKRQDCISCEGVSPVCNCAANEQCILTGRSCTSCAQIECIPNPASSGGKSINPGVIAGPVVAALIILGVAALWWLRRKRRRDLARVEELAERARKAEAAGFHLNSQPGSPGPGSARSARSDRSSERYNSRSQSQSQSRHASRLGPGARSPDPNNRNGNRSPSYDPFSDRNDSDWIKSPIPIRLHSPDDEKNGNANGGGGGNVGRSNSFAARALNEARNNLFKGNQAPARPARSPDLDLRLNPAQAQLQAQAQAQGQHGPPSSFQDLRSPTSSGNYRDSYLSGNSGAPSYLSGSTDLHMDAPKIVTSRQVQVGRLQQAEMVQFGQPRNMNMENLNLSGGGGNVHAGGYVDSPAEMNPFHGSQDSHDDPRDRDRDHLQPPMPMSPATFGSRTLGSEVSGVASGNASYRTLTPASNRTRGNDGDETDVDSEDEEGLYNEPISADLRFSMGSLAYNDNRDSISTMGTGRYLAQHAPPPLPSASNRGGRESMASGRSAADSVLHGFPMIPPGQSRSRSNSNLNNPIGHSPIPQSTSVSTLEHIAMPSRPPTSYRPSVPAPSPATPANRNTQASVGLGGFTFVPPPGDGDGIPSAGLPTGTSDGPPTLPVPRGRNTMGMSTTSEGLGDFDFSFDRDPVPVEQQRT